jgi:hypothetical protein
LSAGDTLQGRHLPDREFTRRLANPEAPPVADGDYGRVYRDGHYVWMCCTPGHHIGDLSAHAVTEFADGTVTVAPSILVHAPGHADQGWHGYLERGRWREC